MSYWSDVGELMDWLNGLRPFSDREAELAGRLVAYAFGDNDYRETMAHFKLGPSAYLVLDELEEYWERTIADDYGPNGSVHLKVDADASPELLAALAEMTSAAEKAIRNGTLGKPHDAAQEAED